MQASILWFQADGIVLRTCDQIVLAHRVHSSRLEERTRFSFLILQFADCLIIVQGYAGVGYSYGLAL